ncbi:MAG TPA: hypothetical protein DDY20_01410 [Desulfobulbaceae bacterium]|nr:hypothetical protein [Desulfobulbaceae bacterium]
MKLIFGNISILALAFLYWFAVDYLYAKNFELYHPYKWLMQLSFLVFALISFEHTYQAIPALDRKRRVMFSLIAPCVLAVIFLIVLYRFGIDFHLWVGYLLMSG